MKTAYYDEVTGLPDLSLLDKVLTDYMLSKSSIHSAGVDRFALVYLDVNNFRYFVETYGGNICDILIKNIANNLENKVANSNHVIRVKNDKFVILFTDIESEARLHENVEAIINVNGNLEVSNEMLYVTMSAGIALYPEHGNDIDTLLKKAETASYFAKSSGKNIYIYNECLQKYIATQVQMVNMLQSAIENEDFTLFYQPEYSLATEEIIGVEALIRWPQTDGGYISPDIFIPIAEKSNQIFPLERWIVQKAFEQKMKWEKEGLSQLELSINLSSKTLGSESDFQKIEDIIKSYQVNYSKITFEITETMMISQIEQAISRLKRLKSYGIKIALDDFGTGYSSLAYILKLPIDIIKIDKSFIKSIPYESDESAITQNIISMAHDLNYRVVAEGIETEEQLEFLKNISCERGQGYLLCRPLPADQLHDILIFSL